MSADRQKIDGSVRRLLNLTPFSLDGLVGVFVALEAALSRGSRGRAGLCAFPSGCQAFAIRAHWRAPCWTLAVYHRLIISALDTQPSAFPNRDQSDQITTLLRLGSVSMMIASRQGRCDLSSRHVCALSNARRQCACLPYGASSTSRLGR